MKGTGTWTSLAALTLGEAIPTIAAALNGRALSSLLEEREQARSIYPTGVIHIDGDPKTWIKKIGAALYTSTINAPFLLYRYKIGGHFLFYLFRPAPLKTDADISGIKNAPFAGIIIVLQV